MANKVLIVDDNKELRSVIAGFLLEEELEVVEAGSGDQAAERLAANGIKLVISDVMMPDGNGLKVLNCCKEKNIPIIIISGYAGQYQEAIEKSGAPIFKKPFNTAELVKLAMSMIK